MSVNSSMDEPWHAFVQRFEKTRERIPALQEFWPGQPFVCKQSEVACLRELYPEVRFVEYDEEEKHPLQEGALNGIHLYSRVNKEDQDENPVTPYVISSAGLIVNEVPAAAIVMTSDKHRPAHHTGINGRIGSCFNLGIYPDRRSLAPPLSNSIIGIGTIEGTPRDFIKYAINPLLRSSGAKFEIEVPVVEGIMSVVRGDLAAFMTYSARPEEVAGPAALCMANAMWAVHLDGELLNWTCPRLKHLLFARDSETVQYVQKEASGYVGRYLTDTR